MQATGVGSREVKRKQNKENKTFSKVLTLTITPSESFASLGVVQDQEKGASAPREFSVGDQRMGGEVGGGWLGGDTVSFLAPCALRMGLHGYSSEAVGSSDEPRARAGLGRPWLSRPGEGEGEGEG